MRAQFRYVSTKPLVELSTSNNPGLPHALIMLSIVLVFGLAGRVGADQFNRIDVLALYWHFVDAVWVVVFTVVYVIGR